MKLRFIAYSGITFPLGDGLSIEEARADAAKELTTARKSGCEVSVLDKGQRWEVQTQANIEGLYVSDDDGYLVIESEPSDDEPPLVIDAREYDDGEGWWDDAA